jgi:hypothetical protein
MMGNRLLVPAGKLTQLPDHALDRQRNHFTDCSAVSWSDFSL